MPFVPSPTAVQAELVYSWDGQTCENVLHYSKPTAWSTEDMLDLAATLVSTWNVAVRPHTSDQVSLIAVKVTNMVSESAEAITYATGLPLAGSATSFSLPNNCALCITKRSALRGRSYRGRIYHLGLTETQVNGNALTGASVTNLINAWENFKTLSVNTESADLVIYSRKSEGNWRQTAFLAQVLTLTTDGKVDSQRRRLPGRGR